MCLRRHHIIDVSSKRIPSPTPQPSIFLESFPTSSTCQTTNNNHHQQLPATKPAAPDHPSQSLSRSPFPGSILSSPSVPQDPIHPRPPSSSRVRVRHGTVVAATVTGTDIFPWPPSEISSPLHQHRRQDRTDFAKSLANTHTAPRSPGSLLARCVRAHGRAEDDGDLMSAVSRLPLLACVRNMSKPKLNQTFPPKPNFHHHGRKRPCVDRPALSPPAGQMDWTGLTLARWKSGILVFLVLPPPFGLLPGAFFLSFSTTGRRHRRATGPRSGCCTDWTFLTRG
ncbi:hypothetical protein QBC39DRAFT_172771 [Podospora conica]|nr:hypothetical protein QBC39DRAFT_172771 [Schizothecium conicum]